MLLHLPLKNDVFTWVLRDNGARMQFPIFILGLFNFFFFNSIPKENNLSYFTLKISYRKFQSSLEKTLLPNNLRTQVNTRLVIF